MIPLTEAQAYVLQGCTPLDATAADSAQALGLVTAEPIMCNEFVPPFNNTAVDGYAVMAADTAAAHPQVDTFDGRALLAVQMQAVRTFHQHCHQHEQPDKSSEANASIEVL